jgi:molecular chaperone DnaJ
MFNMGGRGRKASRVQRGRDLRYDMTLEFEEAVFGVEKEITIRRLEACDDCKGTGARTARLRRPARSAAGAGRCGFSRASSRWRGPARVQRDGHDDHRSVQDVPRRRGAAKSTRILVKVPAGVEQDTRIRYQGEGEAGALAGRRAISTWC